MKFELDRLLQFLKERSIQWELERFSSGAFMLDIRHKNELYVIQDGNNYIGLSTIDSNTGFDAMPDEKYFNEEDFINRLKALLAT